ncbi:tetratricopeptide repeat protein [Flammeovirga pectinis]|uniref:Tetratricopeptide repeat protein n=1 Tax=Flammeovirga pectinis TaxID=2494373 RepID=A0A3Q9FSZ9_9BACT|nr:tetratricopeptide repeat protein [Flammeovirga pectinis]AZQ64445.1 tetratricopeptide repeat protein [Flammeovirga pectinis]
MKLKNKLLIGFSILFFSAAVYQSCTSSGDKESGNTEKATTSLDPHASMNLPYPDSLFLGTETCRSCHEEEYHKWKGSDHDKSMEIATSETVLGDFNDVKFVENNVKSRFFKKGDKFFVNTQGPDGKNHDFEIKYTFGVKPLQNYMVEMERGKIQLIRETWDTEKKRWFNQHDDLDDIQHYEWLHWSNGGGNWNTMCADCHSTNVRKNYDFEKDSFDTKYSIINVSCEACHGPGKEHVDFVNSDEFEEKKDFVEGLYVQQFVKGESARTLVESCAPCHSRRSQLVQNFKYGESFYEQFAPEILREGMYYHDGQILNEVYVYGSFIQSKMYQHDVKCTDCHDPHKAELKFKDMNKICAQCHEPKDYQVKSHTLHDTGQDVRCVDCHMVGEVYMGNDYRRDHSFRIPRPDLSLKYDGTPNACNACHTDKSVKWAATNAEKMWGKLPHDWKDTLALGRHYDEEYVVSLKQMVDEQTAPFIARATAVYYLARTQGDQSIEAVIGALKDPEPLVRLTAIQNLSHLSLDQRVSYLSPYLMDPSRSVRVSTAIALGDVEDGRFKGKWKKAFDKATAEMKIYFLQAKDFREGPFGEGQYMERRKDYGKAIACYQQSLKFDTLMNEARFSLARIYSIQGKLDLAKQELDNAIAVDPSSADAYYSKGLLFAETKEWPAAAEALKKSSELNPQNSRAFYNLGLIYQQMGEIQVAEKTYLMGLKYTKKDPSLRYALAALYEQTGQKQKASLYWKWLKTNYPDDPRFN